MNGAGIGFGSTVGAVLGQQEEEKESVVGRRDLFRIESHGPPWQQQRGRGRGRRPPVAPTG